MTIDKVIALFGTPTEGSHRKHDRNIVYYLGTQTGVIQIDSVWLVIDFDNRKEVEKYEVVID